MRIVRHLAVAGLVAAGAAAGLASPVGAANDRSEIAFTSNRDGSAQVYVMDVDGSHQTRVTNSFPSDDIQPSWSSDGARIAFSRGSGYQSGNVVQSSIVVRSLASGAETVLADDAGINFRPQWSPDGTQIVYVHGQAQPQNAFQGPYDLWLMGANGAPRRRLTTTGDATQPAWSPDGKQIVFNRASVGAASGIWVLTLATGATHRLTVPPAGADYTPSWSPGPRILFTSTRAGGAKQIYTVDPDGSHVRRIMADGAEDKYPSWSSDGRRIVYSRSTVPCSPVGGAQSPGGECSLTQAGGFEIYVMDADGSHQTRLTSRSPPETQFGEANPVWRPSVVASVRSVQTPTPTPPPPGPSADRQAPPGPSADGQAPPAARLPETGRGLLHATLVAMTLLAAGVICRALGADLSPPT
ncbi:MAG: TolB family protein [Acidimicrobiales bacterium]